MISHFLHPPKLKINGVPIVKQSKMFENIMGYEALFDIVKMFPNSHV